MNHLVKHTPIRKNGKTYQVGSKFPYSDEDKSLLAKGYLEEAKDGPTKKAETTKATVKKKPTVKKKTNSKKK